MDKPTPRVNQPKVGQFQGELVRIVGRVLSLRGTEGTLDASGPIEVHLNNESNMREGQFVEIIGKVQPDLSVKIHTTTNIEGSLDLNFVDQVIEAQHAHRQLFY